ncbi:MAG: lysophospholipid acyltransferase family protein [Verrucomicrobiales bacterium]|nr:lysophospholipid acyltransferase family protein [Verrucomicrobiales bacterium]
MLEFSDAPYQFFEAKPSKVIIQLARLANRLLVLPGKGHRVDEIEMRGAIDKLDQARAEGCRLLFVINHPSHSDPQVVTELHRRLGIPSCFMAAYDVYLRSKCAAWTMQRLGNFSIDREGSDRKAMSTAIEVLKKGEQALNIYPEGNVYLTNDRVTPFLDGTAFIAAKAQAALKETKLKIIPISLKYTHLTAPREAVTQRMLALGADSGYVFPGGATADPMGAVLGLGQHIVKGYLESHGYPKAFGDQDHSLYEMLTGFAEHLVDELENSLSLNSDDEQSLVDRIRKIRSSIHQIRTDEKIDTPPDIDGLADKAILAFRINGHLTPYLSEHPTIDRYDETVERIAEDFYSRAMPRTGPRRAIASFGEPMDVSAYLEEAGGKARNAVRAMTRDMESAVQSGIDAINAANDAPGASVIGA